MEEELYSGTIYIYLKHISEFNVYLYERVDYYFFNGENPGQPMGVHSGYLRGEEQLYSGT